MRKLIFRIVIVALSWFGVLGVIYSFRDVLIAPYFKKNIISAAKRQFGLELAVKRIGGSYITGLEIDQVMTLDSNPEGPLVSLKIDRLRLHYSLPALFLSKDLFLKYLTLELQGVRAEINLKDQTVSKRLAPSPRNNPGLAFTLPVLPVLPRMLIQDTVVSLKAPFLSIPELRLESRPEGNIGILIHVASKQVDLKVPALRQQRLSLETDIEYTPTGISFKRFLLDQKSVLETAWFRVEGGRIKEFKLDLRSSQSRLTAAGQWLENQLNAQFAFNSSQLQKIGNWVDWPANRLGEKMEARGKDFPRHSLILQGEILKGELRIQHGVLEMSPGRIQLNHFSAGVGALARSWLEMPFDADLTLQAGDLAPWAKWLGISGINGAWEIAIDGQGRLADFKANARVKCSNVSYQPSESGDVFIRAGKLDFQALIQGSIQDPKFTGQLSLADGQVKLSSGFPVIRDITLKSDLNSSQAVIQTLAAKVGGSPLSISGTVEDFITEQPTFNLCLQGANILFYRSDSLRLRADTDVVVSGPLSKMKVSGEGRITDGLYNSDIDFLGFLKPDDRPQVNPGLVPFSLSVPPFNNLQFAVHITSAGPFLIKNNAATGSVRPELFLGGTGEVPVLTGTVYIDPTLVALPTGILRIQSGVVSFLENFPDIPRLDILARAKMQGYDITLRVAGPYDKPVVTLSSVPPAPNDQLLLLVLTGQSPQPQTGQRFVSTGNLALYLGQGVVGHLFGEAGQGILDRLQMNIGRDISRNGKETLDAQFQITKNWLTTQDVVYLTSERDVYDDYNAGAKIVFQFK